MPSNPSVVLPNQSGGTPNTPGPASCQQDTSLALPSLAADQLNSSTDPVTSALSEVNVGASSTQPTSTRPSPRLVTKPKPVVASQRSRRDSSPPSSTPTNRVASPPDSSPPSSTPTNRVASPASVDPPSNLLAGVDDQPEWMIKKKTLNYFRSTVKFGRLSDVIEHWYELERLLGFQQTVSTLV